MNIQVLDSVGAILLEREKTRATRTGSLTLRARRLSHGLKKTIRPVVMSKEEFFEKVVNQANNGSI